MSGGHSSRLILKLTLFYILKIPKSLLMSHDAYRENYRTDRTNSELLKTKKGVFNLNVDQDI
jgi:hypothetical protein